MSLTAPYSNSMRIGQGFNTYTQEIRLEGAVKVGRRLISNEPNKGAEASRRPPTPPVTPDVTAATNPLGDVPVLAINGVSSKSSEANGASTPTSNLGSDLGAAIDLVTTSSGDSPFDIPSGPTPTTSQSVTYSTRAIENVSDIMDALNISTSMSIKYGTIHGNGNASFVNENKVLDSDLNYVVTVIVNNDARSQVEDMEFQDIPGLPLDLFTEVYGDSFISGFTEGGEFNAVISIKLNDKSKHKAVKQSVDVQLAVGPPTLEVGASEAFDKEHNETLKNTEISISVNWVGGGEIKRPQVPWTIKTVVAVANAFPSMVARSSARTQAILTRYTSLRSFQIWKWKMISEERNKWISIPANQPGGENNKDGKQKFEEPVIILNYVPCSLYTADLFDALMNYKKLWKRIGYMLQNPAHYKSRPIPSQRTLKKKASHRDLKNLSPVLTKDPKSAVSASESGSPCETRTIGGTGIERVFTFNVEKGAVGWNLADTNTRQDPILPEPVALNEARLLCREAMTLITEEASRLVDHPHLAYAEFNEKTKTTQMKRPNYAYPETLAARLPIPIYQAIISDLSTDGAYIKTMAFANADAANESIWFEPNMVGDPKLSAADLTAKFGKCKYEDFSTLELTEGNDASQIAANPLRGISIHRYRQHSYIGWLTKASLSAANNAIGAIGLSLLRDDASAAGPDGCVHYLGQRHHADASDASSYKHTDISSAEISRIDIGYVPGTGYIAGIVVYDLVGGSEVERLGWRQWGNAGKEPIGLTWMSNAPPERNDGTAWQFIGLTGSWIDTLGHGHLLARLSGVWRKVGL